ncbi:FtsW/RodA/SpoVE family cell cycle protein [Desulforamulus aquiferis]|uniref:FtsW/RodA/SpoVE family cell cycle protein n=1 Tax=Desulforamulus aquiferis TaxID=1397668 RepID=A0AAW7ZBU8_9FIRM|nr:FtsW/RodA/SpoVE family cell cycle protein [Desulforamulus aquiferis]MDO7786576.1 FtsW/RodA/SpoVE family cell cycle protein [Desulforamulus aquiferis]
MGLEQNQRVQGYLNLVCAQIKWAEVHEQVKLELLTHIEDCVGEYLAEDIPESEAIEKAIHRMGDSKELGRQLHKTHKPPINWKLCWVVAFLTGMGLITLLSVELQGTLMSKLSFSVFTNSVIHLVLGFAVLLAITFFDYRRLKAYGWHIFIGTMLIWLLLLGVGGTVVNGKPYWTPGFINIDYIGITPFLLSVSLAGIFFNQAGLKGHGIIKAFVLFTVPNVFYIISNSLSTALIYTLVFLILLFLAGASRKLLGYFMLLPIFLFGVALLQSPYQLDRLLAFMNPYQNPDGSGYIYIQSLEAIKSAGLWGQGFTFSGNLPEFHTDLVFSYLVYTFGWVVGAVVIISALALLIIMASVAKQVKDSYGFLLVSGLTSILALHFIWNIFMTVGFAPISGINLPFISYGGSQMVINLAIMGIVLSVYRRKNLSDPNNIHTNCS